MFEHLTLSVWQSHSKISDEGRQNCLAVFLWPGFLVTFFCAIVTSWTHTEGCEQNTVCQTCYIICGSPSKVRIWGSLFNNYEEFQDFNRGVFNQTRHFWMCLCSYTGCVLIKPALTMSVTTKPFIAFILFVPLLMTTVWHWHLKTDFPVYKYSSNFLGENLTGLSINPSCCLK